MKQVEIGNYCKIINGSTPSRNRDEYWNGDIDWFTPKDLSGLRGKYVDEAPEKITEKGYKSCSTTMIPPNSLLYTSRAPIGHLAINKRQVCTNQGFKSLVPDSNLDVEYLFWVLKKVTPQLQDLGNGATFKELSKSTISSFKIPLPPLSIQRKITEVLDTADRIRQRNKDILSQYDQLAQSVFLEMFGEDLGESYYLKDIAHEHKGTFSNGPFGSDLLTSELQESGVPVIYIRDIAKGQYIRKSQVFVSEEKSQQLSNCQVISGDILIAKVGTPPGTAAVYPNKEPTAIITQDVVRLRLNSKIATPEFIQYWFNSALGSRAIRPIMVEGTRMRFGLGDLKKVRIVIPPLDLQNQFAAIVKNIEEQKTKAQTELDKSEELFQSLMQRAFKGELDFTDP